MRYEVSEDRFDGEGAIVLVDRAADLQAVIVPGVGSNLIALDAPSRGIRYLDGPASLSELKAQPTRYGNPVLLPPNRIRQSRFEFAGRSFRLPSNKPPHHIHGLVHSLPWGIAGLGADEEGGAWVRTVMEAREHPYFYEVFPYRFTLTLTFALRDGRLRLTAEAVNGGPGPFPFGLGYHTYFRLPPVPGEQAGGYRLTLPARRRWELDSECLPTGRLLPLSEGERLQAAPVAKLRLDDIYTDLSPGEPEIRAELRHEATGRGIEFVSDRGFPHWVVWSGPEPGSPFVCLEPYTCITDAPNLPLPLETTGLVSLAEGAVWRGWVEFRPL